MKNIFQSLIMCFLALALNAQEAPIKVIEEMPRFPGCESSDLNNLAKDRCASNKMLQFIYGNLKYPEAARANGTEGTAVVQFVVDKDGTLDDLSLKRDPGDGCGEAAMDVIRLMNEQGLAWTPGKQRGETARVTFTLPIKFKLDKNASKRAAKNRNKRKKMTRGDKEPPMPPRPPAPPKEKDLTPPPPPPPAPEVPNEEFFKVVEQMPRFPGCEMSRATEEQKYKCAQDKLINYIATHLKYPKEAKENGVEGKCVLQFVVTKTGIVDQVKILRDIGAGCGEAAADVMRQMNTDGIIWKPGMQRGKAVGVVYTLPINFELPKPSGNQNIKEAPKPDRN